MLPGACLPPETGEIRVGDETREGHAVGDAQLFRQGSQLLLIFGFLAEE